MDIDRRKFFSKATTSVVALSATTVSSTALLAAELRQEMNEMASILKNNFEVKISEIGLEVQALGSRVTEIERAVLLNKVKIEYLTLLLIISFLIDGGFLASSVVAI